MQGYLNILSENLGTVLFGMVIIALLGGITYSLVRRKPATKPDIETINQVAKINKAQDNQRLGKTILGTGTVRCIAIRNSALLGYDNGVNIIDFTTMPVPIGELHFADTSCPVSGGVYTVKENADGALEDYDPRQVPMDVKTTPERAYQATHWPELAGVWNTPLPFYKNERFWLAIAALIVMFFLAATAMGA